MERLLLEGRHPVWRHFCSWLRRDQRGGIHRGTHQGHPASGPAGDSEHADLRGGQLRAAEQKCTGDHAQEKVSEAGKGDRVMRTELDYKHNLARDWASEPGWTEWTTRQPPAGILI